MRVKTPTNGHAQLGRNQNYILVRAAGGEEAGQIDR